MGGTHSDRTWRGTVENCINHPDGAATWHCRDCGGDLCDECVETITVQGCTVELCRACRGHCVPAESQAKTRAGSGVGADERPFVAGIPSAFAYPIRGSGPVVLVMVALFALVLLAVGAWIGRILAPYGFILTIAIDIFVCGYIVLMLLNTVAASARGEGGMPLTPAVDFDNPMASAALPLFLLIGCGALCFAPAVAYYGLGGRHMDALFAALLAIGALYFPMALLAVSVYEQIEALSPGPIVRSIVRVFGDYLLACIVFYVLIGLAVLAWRHITFRPAQLALALRLVVLLYATTAAAHVLGRLYHANRARLRWMGVDVEE